MIIDFDTTTLNELYTALNDADEGYENAAAATDQEHHKRLFLTRSAERRAFANTIRSMITERGGTVDEGGSLIAGADRLFSRITSALSDDELGLIASIERAEQGLLSAYEKALDRADPKAPSFLTVRNQQTRVRADRNFTMRLAEQA